MYSKNFKNKTHVINLQKKKRKDKFSIVLTRLFTTKNNTFLVITVNK